MCIRGIVRSMDSVGRIVVPKEMRKALGINDGDDVEILYLNNSVVLKKHEISCKICGSSKNLIRYRDAYICRRCISELAERGTWNLGYTSKVKKKSNLLV